MKILIVMDPGILVPPKGYGGHERLVYMFAKEYARLGHEVHLLVTEGSEVEGCTVHPFGKEGFPPKKWDARMAIPKAWQFLWKYRNKFDLIHNFGRLAYLLPVLNHPIKKIMSYGRIIDGKNISLINRLPNKNLVFTAPSNWCVNTGNTAGEWYTVYNAVDFSKYKPKNSLEDDAPLIFLSRIEKLKGAHEAIQIALQTGNRLILAGNISPLVEEQEYFKSEIEPFIDGEKIQYVGTLDDEGKNQYLGKAKAMLFPARTGEAFGMVMAEAMACGTPVLAYNLAAMPEVVTNGITGFICEDLNEMAEKINDAVKLDRTEVRSFSESRFDVRAVAFHYLSLFK
ncbi:MAG: glycosyltransferase [Chitinophagaceae bacterium]